MSNIIKLVVSFIILILISILISFFLFYSKIDIGFIRFFNTHLEQKYQKEINKIGEKIEIYINQIDFDINQTIQRFDFSKFIDKARSKNFDLVNEDNLINQLMLKYNDIFCVKFFDINKNLLFSSLEKERLINRNIISFVSLDKVENIKNIYLVGEERKTQLLFFNEFVIFKKNILYNNKIIGVMLFYFKDSFLLNILLQNEYFKYESLNFINDSLIFINKPKEILIEELNKLTIDENSTKLIGTSLKDFSGENIVKLYKNFKYKFRQFNLTLLRLVDNNIFIMDKRKSSILVFLFLFTLYILILLILSFKKSDFDKAKEKVSLFSTMLLEEIINSRTKDEIEKLKAQLGQRKKSILSNIYTDFKKLSDANKKNIEEQLDIILKKIEEAMVRNLENIQNVETIQKMEQLFERLITTITEKGIALNYNPNSKVITKNQIPDYSSNKVKAIENIGEPEQIEELEEIGEAEEVEEVEEVGESEGIQENREEDSSHLLEHIEDAEEFNLDIFSSENNIFLKREPLFKPRKEEDDIVIYEVAAEDLDQTLIDDNKKVEEINTYEEEEIDINAFPSILNEDNKNDKKEQSQESDKKEKKEKDIDNVEDLFDIKKEDLIENSSFDFKNEGSDIEDIEIIDEEVPKIPDDFYEITKKLDDDLAKEIKSIEAKKTPLQELLDNICKQIGVSKFSLFINSININSFIQSYQIGFSESRVEKYTLDINNILVQHIFKNERLVYVADMNKIKFIFQKEDIYNDYNDMKALLIYPLKIFGKIRVLLFLAFSEDKRDLLESIIEILENNKNIIIKNVLKLI